MGSNERCARSRFLSRSPIWLGLTVGLVLLLYSLFQTNSLNCLARSGIFARSALVLGQSNGLDHIRCSIPQHGLALSSCSAILLTRSSYMLDHLTCLAHAIWSVGSSRSLSPHTRLPYLTRFPFVLSPAMWLDKTSFSFYFSCLAFTLGSVTMTGSISSYARSAFTSRTNVMFCRATWLASSLCSIQRR